MNNPRDNRTISELALKPWESLVYTLPLDLISPADREINRPGSRYFFRDASDREAFANIFRALGWQALIPSENKGGDHVSR